MSEAAVSPKVAEYVAKWHARGQKKVTPVQGRELRYLTMEGVSPKHLGDKLKLATATVNTAIKRVGPGPGLITTSKLFRELVASGEIWQAVGWDRALERAASVSTAGPTDESEEDAWSDGNQTDSEDWEAEEELLDNRPPWKVAYNTGGAKTLQDVLEATAPPLIARLDDIKGCGVTTVDDLKELGRWTRSSQKKFAARVGMSAMEEMVLSAYAKQLATDDAVQPNVLRAVYGLHEATEEVSDWIQEDGKPEQLHAVARGLARAGITQRSDLVQLGWMGEEWLVGLISMLLPEKELSLVVLRICEKILDEVKEVWDVWCAMPAVEHEDYFVYE